MENLKTINECIEWAISGTMSLTITPCWRTFDPPWERKQVHVLFENSEGEDIGAIMINL